MVSKCVKSAALVQSDSKPTMISLISKLMKICLTLIVLIVAALLIEQGHAQDTKPLPPGEKPKESSASTPAKPKPTTEELEQKFIATLTKATMAGRWCSTKNGVRGPEKEDKYTTVVVKKDRKSAGK